MTFERCLALILALSELMATGLGQKDYYHRIAFENVCKSGKTVIALGNRAGIFTLKIPHLNRDFNCHLELEAKSYFGLHVYIEEMNFRGSEDSPNGGCGEDFIRFARDVVFITTYLSPKYCGIKRGYNSSRPHSKVTASSSDGRRMHVENRDSEMDVWLTLSSKHSKGPRNLTLVVTPFKSNCGSPGSLYGVCSRTSYCILKEYFCDGHVNCAWPGGDHSTDEAYCRKGKYVGPHKDSYGDLDGSITNYYNIPLIIVVIIIVLAGLIALSVALAHFYRRFRKTDEAGMDGRRREELVELYSRTPSLTRPPLVSQPSAPPSYEDAISNETLIRDDPPPYTPSESVVT